MAAPLPIIPIDFLVQSYPPDVPRNVQELLNTVGNTLAAEFDSRGYIIGLLNGILPMSNAGPWDNQSFWWFFDTTQGKYVPTDDGVPVGTIMLWGGQGTPVNWLLCDGSEVSRTDYNGLFQVISTDWGNGDGQDTFNLPPGAVMYLNDSSFVPAAGVPIASRLSPTSTWGMQGGQQVAPLLVANNLPKLDVTVPYANQYKLNDPGGPSSIAIIQFQGTAGATLYEYQVRTPSGEQLQPLAAGLVTQTQFSTMPPFTAANHIIKYQ